MSNPEPKDPVEAVADLLASGKPQDNSKLARVLGEVAKQYPPACLDTVDAYASMFAIQEVAKRELASADPLVKTRLTHKLHDRFSQLMESLGLFKPVVISVHGVWTTGKWQKDISPLLADKGFTPVALDYGKYLPLKLLWWPSRKRKIEWLYQEYTKVVRERKGCPISIVAHSFGTYLVAQCLWKYRRHMKYDRIILSGCIIRKGYPWPELIDGGRVNAVLNDMGGMDWVVKLASWFVHRAGRSGCGGFTRPHMRLYQLDNPEHGHSDTHNELNYTETWIPFLRGEEPSQGIVLPAEEQNWRFVVVVAVVCLAVLAAGLWFVWSRFL